MRDKLMFLCFALSLLYFFVPGQFQAQKFQAQKLNLSFRRVKGDFYLQRLRQIVLGEKKFILDRKNGRIISRPSISGKRVLKEPSFSAQALVEGIDKEEFILSSEEDLIKAALRNKEDNVLVFTGGGDAAGINAVIAAMVKKLKDLNQNVNVLGVKKAGAGLAAAPDEFAEHLLLIDELAAEDIKGQSSTALGSSRVNPFKGENLEHALANISGFEAWTGTGGDDNLKTIAEIAKRFPNMVVVGTPKTIDGDVMVNGRPVETLGFDSAVKFYRQGIYNAAQNAATHGEYHVIETFGRLSGRLAFESARTDPGANAAELSQEDIRKIIDYGDTIMILVPEKPVSLRQLAEQAKDIHSTAGGAVVVVAEGFMPSDLWEEMNRLKHDTELAARYLQGNLSKKDIVNIYVENEDVKRLLLLEDGRPDDALIQRFADLIWKGKYDEHGNIVKLAGVRHFVMAAMQKLAGIGKVNELLRNYDGRGATPTQRDIVMGTKIGAKMAELVYQGVTGGKGIVYFQGMNPFTEEPQIVDIVPEEITSENNLTLYPDELLSRNGVFWVRQ